MHLLGCVRVVRCLFVCVCCVCLRACMCVGMRVEVRACEHASTQQQQQQPRQFSPSGKKNDKFREMVGKFRHFIGDVLGKRSTGFHALWVVNFPLVEWNEEQGRHTVRV